MQKRVKWCTNCKKPYHTRFECDGITGKDHKDNKKPGGGSGGNKGGSKGGSGGKDGYRKPKDKDSKDEKPKKKRPRRNSSDSGSETEVYVAYTAETDGPSPRWALDCACSQHSTPNKDNFIEYRPLTDTDDVRPIKGIADSLTPTGIGRVRIPTITGGKRKDLVLSDVLHVPGMPLSLISQGQLMRVNTPLKLVQEGVQIGSRGITAWLQANNLYCLRLWESRSAMVSFNAESGSASVSVPKEPHIKFALLHSGPNSKERSNPVDGVIPIPAESDSDSSSSFGDPPSDKAPGKVNEESLNLWHARLGHLGHQNVKKLARLSKGMDLSKAVVNKEPCEPCAVKKSKRASHKAHIRPGKGPLDLIHSDICGPITPRGRHGGKFFITFMDDWDKRSEAEIIERKSEAWPAFKRFCARNETPYRKVRRLRTDYGGEYEDYGFDIDRAECGISWEPIVPGNPEQNGAVERLG